MFVESEGIASITIKTNSYIQIKVHNFFSTVINLYVLTSIDRIHFQILQMNRTFVKTTLKFLV